MNLWFKSGRRKGRQLSLASLLTSSLVACAWLLAGGAASSASAQGDGCPNAEFRTGHAADLPNCRAYEQVSPVDKNGGDVNPAPMVASRDGQHVGFGSQSSFADPEGAASQNGYGSTSTGTDWQTVNFMPMSPFDEPLGGSYLYATSEDFTTAVVSSSAALAPGATEHEGNVYARHSDGSYEFIGTPQDNPVGPSGPSVLHVSDGRVIFDAHEAGYDPSPAPPNNSNLYEFSNGELKPLGVLPDGTLSPSHGARVGGQANMSYNAISADGSRAYWKTGFPGSSVTNPEPIYLYEGGPSTLVSERESDGSAQPALFYRGTPDGSHAVLTSEAQLTNDANASGFDLYRYDADAGDLTNLTPDSVAAADADLEGALGISDDGSRVYFQATGELAPGATEGEHNIYVWDQGEISLIATSPVGLREITRGRGDNWRVSADGRYLGFLIDDALTGPNPQPAQATEQAYLYDLVENTLVCASCPPGGASATEDVRFDEENFLSTAPSNLLWKTADHGRTRNVSTEGSLFFHTTDPLVPEDTNGRVDVYEYVDGQAHLLSTGRGRTDSFFGDATADGEDVFIMTDAQLVTQDRDPLDDLYNVRVNGGLASQNPPPTKPECQGDECQGEPSSPPAAEQPETDGPGAGNPPVIDLARCETLENRAQRKADRSNKLKRKARKLKHKARKAKRKARKADGKKATKRLNQRSKRLQRKAKRKNRQSREANLQANNLERKATLCRQGGSQ